MDGMVSFLHEGREYTADVVSSENLQPHYYWILFKNPEMQKQLGDDVAFVENEGNLKSIHPSVAKRNSELLEIIKDALKQHLQKR